MKLAIALCLFYAWLGACTKLQEFGGDSPPLATIQLEVTGEFASVRSPLTLGETPSLHVALVWGAQWLTEPLCVLPAESPEMGAVIAQGCRDTFGFVPARVGADVPLDPGVPATLQLFSLPTADLMVGDLTARVAYGSLVVYDDRDGTGSLEFRSARHAPSRMDDMMDNPVITDGLDLVYGGSFISMANDTFVPMQLDQRLAYREGAFVPTAFYPRGMCDAPLPAFSIVSASGFTNAVGLASAGAGLLPPETDATQCAEQPTDAAVVTFPFVPPATGQFGAEQLACTERVDDSSARYREPPADAPDFTNRLTACGHLPSFGGPPSDLIQLVVSGRSDDLCVGLTHYTLRGCRENVLCDLPDWDYTATPPAWWPCTPAGAR